MNKFQIIIDTIFLGGTVGKLKVALKDATLKMLRAQEEQSQLEEALLANHDMRLELESRVTDLSRELEHAYSLPMNERMGKKTDE